ncbi:MAG TPA: hypothetical protein VLF18_13740 [Tahibacter sp.]|uniref:hypothetical protein n=1 Tax=Tahibacter sp. TaxID=2056211 RepID=UPI002D0C073B|nr:hypothetical protein [Tahibacter sp.]HSX61257.1 hypothetical protein [Tahibacter sp.]
MIQRGFLAGLLLALASGVSAHSSSTEPPALRVAPKVFAVDGVLDAPPRDVAELRFQDVYTLPVGPRGLEITDRLRELDGRRVRLVGYMVHADVAGGFVLSPLPAALGDADEALADDLPPTAVLVDLPRETALRSGHMPGLIQVIGRLRVGRAESETLPGRVFPARVELDARFEKALRKANK